MANYHKAFVAISSEFGSEVALAAIQIYSINLLKSTSELDEFYENPEAIIRRLARELLWETPEKDFDFVFKVYQCIYDWETRQSLQGLGGCVTKSFKELLDNK